MIDMTLDIVQLRAVFGFFFVLLNLSFVTGKFCSLVNVLFICVA